MDIVLFNELTTEDQLSELEAKAEKYEGLWVDMNEKEQRKIIKDDASHINDLLKKLDRKRIDLSKSYKVEVEKQAASIKVRLENANKHNTLLIDEYNEERAKVLQAEKDRLAKIDLLARIEVDHEFGLLMNKNYAAEKAVAEQQRKDYEANIAKEASERTIEQERIKQANIKQAKINAENARLANVEHVRSVNRSVYSSFINAGLDAENAKLATQALIDGAIKSTKINY
tara:strand:+ start:19442 stop:20128 length:687 start_codon:yes stop_codon:yes gene_type:complete